MIYLFRYSLSLIIIVLIHAKKEKHSIKQKRDISDLKDDPILTSIFKSDLQEKRRDRSISLKDEKEAARAKSDNVKQQELLKNMLLSAKDLYRRDTYNSPYDGGLNSSLPIPDSYYASYTNPIIGSQIPLPASAKLQSIYDQGNAESAAAVVPKLFAANYMPLEGQMMATAMPVAEANNEVTKRDSIIHPSSDVKSELVSAQSIPLQLRKYTPNKQLRGIVPHASEYGETVESVQRAQKVMDIKKSMMPGMPDAMAPAPMLLNFAPVSQSMYSQDVIKKDVIPGQTLPSPAAPAVDDAPKISAPIPVDLVPKVPAPVDPSAPQISAPVAVDLVPKVASPAGVEATNADQKSTVAATQVQNLDGSYTRPIITDDTNERSKVAATDEECADQYASCADFAKNQYCTKYYKLMEIQCRKSCGFCVAGDKPLDKKKEEIALPSNASANATSDPEGKKLVESAKNETKGSKRSSTAKKPSDAHKKSSEASKKKTESAKKTSVSSKKSADKSKKSDTSKKATEKKSASKKSADTSKKHASDAPSKSKSEAKSTTTSSKKSKEEKHKEEKIKKEEKEEAEKKSKLIDSESGSTNEGDSQEDSGSGDLGSGDLGSGSGSGSGDDEPTPTVALEKPVETKTKVEKEKKQEKEDKVAKKSTVSKKSKVPATPSKVLPGKVTKSNLGEFTLPVAKSEVSTASLTLDEKNEADESGSGSASGDDSEVEEKVITVKKTDVGKPKSGGKATAKKSATKPKAVIPTKKVKKNKVAIKIKKSKKPEKPSKKSKVPKPQKEKHIVTKTKKSSVPEKPKKLTSYPKIDLKLIASALAHYEEAALELAGEYPKAPSNEVARSNIPRPEPQVAAAVAAVAPVPVATAQRSTIPHPHMSEAVGPPLRTYEKKELIIDPLDKYKQNLEIAKLLTDDRNGRSNIPKYLKLTKDVKKGESDEAVQAEYAADSLPSIQKRFNILGIEPTLIDYYAETGKINPFAQKHKKKEKNVKKSNILNSDPYEYLRNMPAGASMLPIDDPKARSKIPSDHSYPVFLMKVSPGERKYVDEPPMRRGEIRHLNAEGVRIDDKTEVGGLPKDILQKLKSRNSAATAAPKPNVASKRTHQPAPSKVPAAASAAAAPVTPNPFASAGLSMYTNPFYPNAEQAMAMMSVAANLQNNLKMAQNSLPQAKTVVPKTPAPAKAQLKRPVAAKGAVPRPVPAPGPGGMSAATIKAMEKSAMSGGFQYAQNQMKMMARSKAARPQTMHLNAAQKQALMMAAQQRSMVKSALDIAQATSPHINPALAGETPVNDLNSLKNKMVSAFFPMKKDGVAAEGSGEVAKG